VLLYGPPGTASIAAVIAEQTSQVFVELSATSAGVKEVRAEITAAEKRLTDYGSGTVLFLDEIHRFSKAQQDILLPVVEKGLIALIGATTENPSFSVNSALVSRSILMVLRPLERGDLVDLLNRAIDEPRGLDGSVSASGEALDMLADLSSGDTRQALNRLETAAETTLAADSTEITPEIVRQVTGSALQRYDRDGDQHYDIISAFIKSMRGSDPDAALHWLARMIEAGEDPRFIARRLIVHASEDVGMADPGVLGICMAAAQAVALIGLPEARINLAQAAVAVAIAPKSPGIIAGIDTAIQDVRAGRTGNVPVHLRDAHYPGAKALGHGEVYRYPHSYEHGVVAQQYLPAEIDGTRYYEPTRNGFEQTVADRSAGRPPTTRTRVRMPMVVSSRWMAALLGLVQLGQADGRQARVSGRAVEQRVWPEHRRGRLLCRERPHSRKGRPGRHTRIAAGPERPAGRSAQWFGHRRGLRDPDGLRHWFSHRNGVSCEPVRPAGPAVRLRSARSAFGERFSSGVRSAEPDKARYWRSARSAGSDLRGAYPGSDVAGGIGSASDCTGSPGPESGPDADELRHRC